MIAVQQNRFEMAFRARHRRFSPAVLAGGVGMTLLLAAILAGAIQQRTLAPAGAGARASLDPSRRSLALGGSGLRYTGLTAYDARGRSLPAWLDLAGGTVLLRVDDRNARYPLAIDPFVQVAKLTASDAQLGDSLG